MRPEIATSASGRPPIPSPAEGLARSSGGSAVLAPFASFLLFIALWQGVTVLFRVPEYLVPQPLHVLQTLRNELMPILADMGVTLAEALMGLTIGALAGFLSSILFSHSKLMSQMFQPYFIALQAIPIVAVAPLLVIWFGTGMTGKVVMAAIVCFFPIVVNTTRGLVEVDPDALQLMDVLSATRAQTFTKLRLPSARAYIFSALKISATLSVLGAIVAELPGAKAGIGYRILISSYQVDTRMLFASIIVAGLGGLMFYGSIAVLERFVFARELRDS